METTTESTLWNPSSEEDEGQTARNKSRQEWQEPTLILMVPHSSVPNPEFLVTRANRLRFSA